MRRQWSTDTELWLNLPTNETVSFDLCKVDWTLTENEGRLLAYCYSFDLFPEDSLHFVFSSVLVKTPLRDLVLTHFGSLRNRQ